jgi:hypothetical protein
MRETDRFPSPAPRRGITRRTLTLAAAAGLGLALAGRPGPAAAQSLDQARAQGLVGERRDGYVGVVQSGAGVQDLVNRVNAQRRQEYERIAADTGAPLAAVEARAAEQLINRLSPGMYFMNASGQWERK